jgi:hypothetical protein
MTKRASEELSAERWILITFTSDPVSYKLNNGCDNSLHYAAHFTNRAQLSGDPLCDGDF